MKVIELRQILRNMPDNYEVILQKDGEGNGYSPCAGADDDCAYVPACTWGGEVYALEELADECIENYEYAVVLYPIN